MHELWFQLLPGKLERYRRCFTTHRLLNGFAISTLRQALELHTVINASGDTSAAALVYQRLFHALRDTIPI